MKKKKQPITHLQEYDVTKSNTSKMSDEALVDLREELKTIIKEAEEILSSAVDPVLYKRAEKVPGNKYPVENHTVVLVARPVYSTANIAYCRKMSALKEVPDSAILKPLYDKGINIPGLEVSKFVTVK